MSGELAGEVLGVAFEQPLPASATPFPFAPENGAAGFAEQAGAAAFDAEVFGAQEFAAEEWPGPFVDLTAQGFDEIAGKRCTAVGERYE